MNENAFLTRFEIFLYSTLTFMMSGINHLRGKILDVSSISSQPSSKTDFGQILLDDQVKKAAFTPSMETVKTFLLPIFLWIILGFAAGFLIGMLKPR